MLETLLHAHLAQSVISADHINLRIGLQTTLENHICPHIVTNTMLLKLLNDISVKNIGLLFQPEPEFLGLHIAAIRIVHKTASDGLNLYLIIPLRDDPIDTFDALGMGSFHFLLHILMRSCYIIY